MNFAMDFTAGRNRDNEFDCKIVKILLESIANSLHTLTYISL